VEEGLTSIAQAVAPIPWCHQLAHPPELHCILVLAIVTNDYQFLKIEDCRNEDEISALYEEATFCSIIDRSGWPTESVINMKSRFDFVSHILIEELYDKRLPCLQSFREGLDHFRLLRFLQKNPEGWRPFFVKEDTSQQISSEKFLSLLTSKPKNEEEKRAYAHLVQFVNESENPSGKRCPMQKVSAFESCFP
jgi:hypothetical protein